MKETTRRYIQLLSLPMAHLLLCFGAQRDVLLPGNANWSWLIVIIVDMPIAYALSLFRVSWGRAGLTVIGTVWWFLLSLLIERLFHRGKKWPTL
jgi:hypothetical protein